MEGDGAMRQLQVKKIVKRDPARNDPLPLDPRDADVVRAKQRLYEREARATRSDRWSIAEAPRLASRRTISWSVC
jgi:hypothetical protein